MNNSTLDFHESVMIAVAQRIARQFVSGQTELAQNDTRQHIQQMTPIEAALFAKQIAAEIEALQTVVAS